MGLPKQGIFKDMINLIHRFEKAVREVQTMRHQHTATRLNRKYLDDRETEYHASKTELLNRVAKLIRERGDVDD